MAQLKSSLSVTFFILLNTILIAQVQQEEEFSNLCIVDSSVAYITSTTTPILSYPSNIISAIYKTTNFGISWEKHQFNIPDRINNIVFTSKDTGFVTTYYSSNLYKTTNGGESWDSIYNFMNEIRDMKFINSKIGYIVGVYFGQDIYRTSDGGKSWLPYYSGSNQFTGNKLSIVNENILYATNWCCDFSKSVDGGLSWINYRNKLPAVILSIYGLQFTNDNNGFIIGSGVNYANGSDGYPIFAYTSNGGMNWDFQYFNESISDLHFANSQSGWIIASNQVYYSNNRFTTKDSTQLDLKKFAFTSEDVSLGISGKSIYKTYDGWKTYKQIYLINTAVVEKKSDLPKQFVLGQNYPNPFNPSTKIQYSIPKGSYVLIKVYDLLGKEIETLVNEYKSSGQYEIEFHALNIPSGVYYYQLRLKNYMSTKKMILLK